MEYLLIIGLTLLSYWSIIKVSNKRRMIFLNKNKYNPGDYCFLLFPSFSLLEIIASNKISSTNSLGNLRFASFKIF